MKRTLKNTILFSTTLLAPLTYVTPVLAESYYSMNNKDSVGYNAPYTRINSLDGKLYNGAKSIQSTELESTAIEASDQTYVELSKQNSSIIFSNTTTGNGITLRYTVPDNQKGKISVLINGKKVKSLDLDSKQSWQYVEGSKVYDTNSNNRKARFRFDEIHFKLDNSLNKNDKIEIVNDSNTSVGIDFIEIENTGNIHSKPSNSISITDYGAKSNDNTDDTDAFYWALDTAHKENKDLYIPEGTFNFKQKLYVNYSNIKIVGAGMWNTNIVFTSDQPNGGGFEFNHDVNKVELSNMYLTSNLSSRYDEKANYKAISGSLGKDSKLSNLWIEHFECGAWIGDYSNASNMKYTDNLIIENSRIRNNLADGVNFAQGTKNSKVINSNIRGNGDDALATWSSIAQGTESAIAENNIFSHNTIELGWRAAGVGIFGGKGHEVSNNLIKDIFSGAGIRLSTVFDGHNFDLNDSGINIHDNKLVNVGTSDDFYGQKRGAIDFQREKGNINNINVVNNTIINPFEMDINSNFDLNNSTIKLNNNQNISINFDKIQNQDKEIINKDNKSGEILSENTNYKLYWFDGERIIDSNTTERLWTSKASNLKITKDMTFSYNDNGQKVYNFTSDDLPQFLDEQTTKFVKDYNFEGEHIIPLWNTETGENVIARFWSKK